MGALRLCEERLAENSGAVDDILRQRSHLHALRGDYERALSDRADIIDRPDAKLQDFYQAANAALYLQYFEKTEIYLAQLIEKGKAADEDWFASAAHFLTAYAQMMLNKIEEAKASLSQAESIEPTCEIPIPGRDIWDIQKLRVEIEAASRRN